ncbi:MAG: hypothetical protein JW811_00395 [Clostridiales bacterium]|nr:hypothetical protein [Clostridiales bacterium]
MHKSSGGFPPRYFKLLALSLAAAVLRFVPLIPFCLAYFLPLGVWSKLLILFCPLLWFTVVGPVRIRYGELMLAFSRDRSAPLRLKELLSRDQAWWRIFRGRVQLARGKALPFAALTLFFVLPLLLAGNVFAALKFILNVSVWTASLVATSAAFIPRLLMGEPLWVDAGILGGGIALAAAFALSYALLLWGVFQTGCYRFGYTRMPKPGTMRGLLSKNLALWTPTLLLFAAFCAVSYAEILLLLSNILSVAEVFTVKLQPLQIALLALTAASYCVLLPVRKWNTVRWVSDHD